MRSDYKKRARQQGALDVLEANYNSDFGRYEEIRRAWRLFTTGIRERFGHEIRERWQRVYVRLRTARRAIGAVDANRLRNIPPLPRNPNDIMREAGIGEPI